MAAKTGTVESIVSKLEKALLIGVIHEKPWDVNPIYEFQDIGSAMSEYLFLFSNTASESTENPGMKVEPKKKYNGYELYFNGNLSMSLEHASNRGPIMVKYHDSQGRSIFLEAMGKLKQQVDLIFYTPSRMYTPHWYDFK